MDDEVLGLEIVGPQENSVLDWDISLVFSYLYICVCMCSFLNDCTLNN